jgi:hypothetical protein
MSDMLARELAPVPRIAGPVHRSLSGNAAPPYCTAAPLANGQFRKIGAAKTVQSGLKYRIQFEAKFGARKGIVTIHPRVSDHALK